MKRLLIVGLVLTIVNIPAIWATEENMGAVINVENVPYEGGGFIPADVRCEIIQDNKVTEGENQNIKLITKTSGHLETVNQAYITIISPNGVKHVNSERMDVLSRGTFVYVFDTTDKPLGEWVTVCEAIKFGTKIPVSDNWILLAKEKSEKEFPKEIIIGIGAVSVIGIGYLVVKRWGT